MTAAPDAPVTGFQEVWGTAVSVQEPALTTVRVSPDGRRAIYRTADRVTGEAGSHEEWLAGPDPRRLAVRDGAPEYAGMNDALDAALRIDAEGGLQLVEATPDPAVPTRERWRIDGQGFRIALIDAPGRRIAAVAADGKTHLLDARTGVVEGRLDGRHAAFDATGERVALITGAGRIQVRDAATRRSLASFQPEGSPAGIYFSADGKHLVTVGSGDPLEFRAYDAGSGAPRPTVLPPAARTRRVTDPPDAWPLRQAEGALAVESRGRQAWVCHRFGGAAPQPLPGAPPVTWGASGPYLAVIHQDGRLAVYGPPLG